MIPFLWVAPLSIYLLTFILTFDSDRFYRRGAIRRCCRRLARASAVWSRALVALSLGA